MGTVTYVDGIAIWKVVYYTPALAASVYICCRHGFLKSSGWFFLVTFCLTRLIGSCAQLATISQPNHTAETIALVCTLMGTTPLLLSSLGLLSRIYYSILSQLWSIIFQFGVLRIVQLPTAIAFILCIVGATSATSPTQIESATTVHAGIILYAVVFAMLASLTMIAVRYRRKVPEQERILITAVVSALPFILIHIIYSLCATFLHDSAFNLANGSPTALLLMSVLEEMVVVVIYIYAGLHIKCTPLPEDASGPRQLGYRVGRGDFGTGKLGLLSLALGIIRAFGSKAEAAPMEEEPRALYSGRSLNKHQYRGSSTQHHQQTRQHKQTRASGRPKTEAKLLPLVDGRREHPGHFTSDL